MNSCPELRSCLPAALHDSGGADALQCRYAMRTRSLAIMQHCRFLRAAGEHASALLLEAGHNLSHVRLVDVFAQQPSLQLPEGRSINVLSSQSQWESGRALSLLLLSIAGPDVLLPASSLIALRQLLRDRLVVCIAALPDEFIHAMLALGAKGVVSQAAAAPSTASTQAAPEPSCTFFSVFYDALLAGTAVSDCLTAAETTVPVLKGVYKFYNHD